jgi:uncharacterized protein (DUF2267 family)
MKEAVPVDDDDLLIRVQRRGRLHGRHESRRTVCGVLEALGDILPTRALDLLTPQLPDDVRGRLPRRRPRDVPATCRAFLDRVATILDVEQPENAFRARVVLEQLNASLRVINPAAFTHLVAADLRPLLRSGRPELDRAEPARPASRPLVSVDQPAGFLPVGGLGPAVLEERLVLVRFDQPTPPNRTARLAGLPD